MPRHSIPTFVCLHCGKDFRVRSYRIYTARFCNYACKWAWPHRPEVISERFWKFVDKNGPIPTHRPELGQCWIWTGGKNASGYGAFRSERQQTAHRWLWEIERGLLAPGIEVCHHCDNPPCVRIDHLFCGTTLENIADKMAKGRNPKGSKINTARLTEDQVLEIRSRKWSFRERVELARKYGVTEGNIYKIITGEIWKHLLPRA